MAVTLVNYSALVDEVCDDVINQQSSVAEQLRLQNPMIHLFNKHIYPQGTINEDDSMEKLIFLCNNIGGGYKMSYFQKLCLDKMLQIASPKILPRASKNPKEFEDKLNKHGIAVPKKRMCFIGTSRRCGKSDVMTIFMSALLASVPHIKVLFYSTNAKICEITCATAAKWLADWGIPFHKNKTSISVKGVGNDIRQVDFVSGQSRNVSSIYVFCIFIYKMWMSCVCEGKCIFLLISFFLFIQ